MTAPEQLEFPSAPLDADTRATVELVGHDWRADEDWRRFIDACCVTAYGLHEPRRPNVTEAAGPRVGTLVDPNRVREHLTVGGELTINPRRLSAFYNRAAGKDGFLEFSHWGVNEDHKGRNAGRPCRIYRLRAGA